MFSADACVFSAFQAGHPKQHPVALPNKNMGMWACGVREFGLGQDVRNQAPPFHAKRLDAVSSLPRPNHHGKICRRHPAPGHRRGGGVGRTHAVLHTHARRANRLWVSGNVFPLEFYPAGVRSTSCLRDNGPPEVGSFAHDMLVAQRNGPSDLGVFLEQVNHPLGVALGPTSVSEGLAERFAAQGRGKQRFHVPQTWLQFGRSSDVLKGGLNGRVQVSRAGG